jgi:ankyrin repeat protein
VKAINQKDYELMQVLLRLGVPLTAQGKNPLGRMSYYSSADPAELQMLEWLLKNGLSPNEATENPYSPLYYAVKHNNDQAVRVLLRYAANPNMNRTGYTDCSMALPLDIAISQGNDAMVTQLRRAGAYTQTNCH